jgi:hypothetical protein
MLTRFVSGERFGAHANAFVSGEWSVVSSCIDDSGSPEDLVNSFSSAAFPLRLAAEVLHEGGPLRPPERSVSVRTLRDARFFRDNTGVGLPANKQLLSFNLVKMSGCRVAESLYKV